MWQWVAAGIEALFGTATVITRNWDDIKLWWYGKRIVVLGDKETGKTTFIEYLLKGELPGTHQATSLPEKKKGTLRTISELDLYILDVEDVSGRKDSYADWKRIFQSALKEDSVICYFLRGDLIYSGNQAHIDRVKGDMHHISEWIPEKSKRPIIFIIATHCDRIRGYPTASAKKKSALEEKLRGKKAVQDAILQGGGGKYVRFIAGRLDNLVGCEAMASALFSQQSKP